MCQPTTASTSPAAASAPTSSATFAGDCDPSITDRRSSRPSTPSAALISATASSRAELARGSEDPGRPMQRDHQRDIDDGCHRRSVTLAHVAMQEVIVGRTTAEALVLAAQRRRAAHHAPARAGARAPRLHRRALARARAARRRRPAPHVRARRVHAAPAGQPHPPDRRHGRRQPRAPEGRPARPPARARPHHAARPGAAAAALRARSPPSATRSSATSTSTSSAACSTRSPARQRACADARRGHVASRSWYRPE